MLWKCSKCGKTYLDSADAQKALLLNKLKKGVEVKVGQLGNSRVFRFPAKISQLLGLRAGAYVKATPKLQDGKMVLEIRPSKG